MSLIAHEFDLYVTPGAIPPVLHITQYDNARQYTAHLKGENGDYQIPSGATITFEGTNAHKVPFEIAATYSGSSVTFTPDEVATDQPGTMRGDVTIKVGDDQIATLAVIFTVQKKGATKEEITSGAYFVDVVSAAASQAAQEAAQAAAQEAAEAVAGATATAEAAAERAEAAAAHSPKITNSYWYVWDSAQGKYVNTNVRAEGRPGTNGTDGHSPYIGANGNWYVWDSGNNAFVDSGVTAGGGGSGGLSFDGGEFEKVDPEGQESEKYYLHLKQGGEDIEDFTPIEVPADMGGGGGGTAADSVLRIRNTTGSSSLTVGGSGPVNISYSWTSVDSEGDSTGSGAATWTVNGTRVLQQSSIAQGNQSLNVREYLTDGIENVVRLTIEDSYGSTRSLTWRVTSLVYGLSWRLDEFPIAGNGTLNVAMIPTGLGEKTVHLTIDDTTEVFNRQVTTSGNTVTATIPVQTHGPHKIKAWVSATVNGQTITTDPLVAIGIWTENGNMTPFVAMKADNTTVPQFSLVTVKFLAYNPASETASATQTVNGTTVNTLSVNRSVQTWQYRAATAGQIVLGVNVGGYGDTITLDVQQTSEGIGEVTSGLVLKLDPTGHNNAETNRSQFGYTDGNGTNHPLSFSSNFDWTSGGFQTDEDGTAFVVKRGCYAELDTSFFATFTPSSGKEIKLIFKSKNVRDYDAELINCYPDGQSGLVVQAQSATVYGSSAATVPYVEEKLIEMDINIESSGEDKLMAIWLRGIPSRMVPYGSYEWSQGTPKNVRIGSADADVWIYLIRMYDSSLTRADILKNWIADTRDVTEMLDRDARNDIFSSGANRNVDVNKLATAAPKLRQIRITAAGMTTGKKDKITCTVQHVYPAGADNSGNRHNWTATGVTMKAQGTSSLDYLDAAPNIDLDFSKVTSWETEDGATLTGYAMTDASIPVSYFTIKANVASSENANNVVIADDYNTYNPYVCAAKQADSRVRDTVEGHPCVVIFTNNGSEGVRLGSRVCAPGDTMMFFVGDMANSKKNTAVFGQSTDTYPLQCCIELTNNNNDPVLFKGPITAEETFVGAAIKNGDDHDDNFEFRFPDEDFTPAMIAAFREMHAWVVSTDPTQATGAALSPYGVYDGVQYQTDTAAYRKAKFKAEVSNYFVVDSLTFHYLFTERHCMVDNRAKNTFVSYEWVPSENGYRWNWRCDYDNDTAEGNDNSGGLTFTYGLEDTDTVGNAHVFNAYNSVLWCNVRDCLQSELAAMYINRESAGAWDSARILRKFNEYQSARPEALDVEDMWGKYVAPYSNGNNTTFLPMLLGRKTDQREQFEVYEEYYDASKYGGNLWRNDFIGLRGNTVTDWQGVEPGTTLVVTMYADCYPRIDFGNAGTSNHPRAKRGVETTLSVSGNINLMDLEIQLRGARMFKSIKGLAAYYSKRLAIASAPKLQELEFGSRAVGYANTSIGTDAGGLALGDLPLLETAELSGLPNLRVALDLARLTFLREIYAVGSGFTEVTFAENAPVEIAMLPSVSGLIARGLTALRTFTMSGANLVNLWVERSPLIDTYALVSASTRMARIRLLDVDWSAENADAVVPLAYVSGYDATGAASTTPVLTGEAYFDVVTQGELNTMSGAFSDLDLSYGQLVQSYTVTFQDSEGNTLFTDSVRSGGTARDPVALGIIDTPTKESTVYYNYTFAGWSPSLENITQNVTVTPQFSQQTRRYTVLWYNGVNLLQSATVEAGSNVRYTGEAITPPSGKIWGGFDQLTSNVTQDIITFAVFYEPKAPSAYPDTSQYDFIYSDNPADNMAYTFEEFWYICTNFDSNGDVLARSYFNKGDRIKIVPNTTVFTDASIILQLEAFKHFKTADRAGWTNTFWGMVGLMNSTHNMRTSNTNNGGYNGASSSTEVTMAKWLDNTIFPALPERWRAIIQTASVPSSAGQSSADIVYSQHNIFLRSYREVGFGSATPYANEVDYDGTTDGADEAQLTIYNSAAARIKKTYNGTGTASSWWLRSPAASSSTSFAYVNSGGVSNTNGASDSNGVSWGFCIGSKAS